MIDKQSDDGRLVLTFMFSNYRQFLKDIISDEDMRLKKK